MKKVELLAPAGSIDVMKAVIAAGADAVYMGLSSFSARAYADNPDTESYAEAIRYAHVRDVKLYLTLNTLIKEKEISEIVPLVTPLYEAGLDGIIMQDIGAMICIHEAFPDLPIHISTQGTVTGPYAASLYRTLGAKRIVPARECSLKEIIDIREKSGLQVETFIHGALCYSYSGLCLFSSAVGGRSGNRGRCAQPCRMEYTFSTEKKSQEGYLLSLKDLSTIEILPMLIEAGIDSLKIEGRMKKAEYAAGVTSVYRKKIDSYYENPSSYHVTREEKETLFSLFNREGFTDGYYLRENGAGMLAVNEKEFRREDTELIQYIRESYIRKEKKMPVKIRYSFRENEPYRIWITEENKEPFYFEGKYFPEKAEKQSTGEEDVNEKLSRIGNTPFSVSEISGEIDSGLFLPASSLNGFRRDAFDSYAEYKSGRRKTR